MRKFGDYRAIVLLIAAWAGFESTGCGVIGDPDRTVIAKIDTEEISRADLKAWIRSLSPVERPNIQTRQDVVDAVHDYIDMRLKYKLADRLTGEGKIDVPREIAEAQYYQMNPDVPRDIPNPEAFGISREEWEAMKEEREHEIDRLHERIEAEQAVRVAANELFDKKELTISDAEFEEQFKAVEGELMTTELATFLGLLFPSEIADAQKNAVETRERLDGGAEIEGLIQEYAEKQLALPIGTQVPNDPRRPEVMSFWEQASGAAVGAYIGPVFIQGLQLAVPNGLGGFEPRTVPPGFLVCKILERSDSAPMTLEQAKAVLAPDILYTKMIDQLWKEARAEVFPDKVYDPALFDDASQESIIRRKTAPGT